MPALQALWINDNGCKFPKLFVSICSLSRKQEWDKPTSATHSKLQRFTVILQVLMELAT